MRGMTLVSGGCDNAVRIWAATATAWEKDTVLAGHTGACRAVRWRALPRVSPLLRLTSLLPCLFNRLNYRLGARCRMGAQHRVDNINHCQLRPGG